MKTKKSMFFILLLFIFLSLLAFFSIIIFPPGADRNKKNASLAFPNAGLLTDKITIAEKNDVFEINLEKTNNLWFLRLDDTHIYPARNDMIIQFIDELTKKRIIRKTKSQDGNLYGINTDRSISVYISGDKKKSFSGFNFGSTNASGSERYLRIDASRSIVAIEDTISRFLTTRASSWAEMEIFSNYLKTAGIQRVLYESLGFRKEYRAGTHSEIPELEYILKTFRCIDITNIPFVSTEKLFIVFGDSNAVRLDIAALDDTNFIVNITDTGASYIISKWTKEKIDTALGLR